MKIRHLLPVLLAALALCVLGCPPPPPPAHPSRGAIVGSSALG